MAGFRRYVISIITLIVFIFFIFSFIGSYIGETNPTSELLNSKYGINQTIELTQSRLGIIQQQINQTSVELANSKPDPIGYLFLIARGLFYIPLTIFGFIVDGIILIPTVLFGGLGGTGTGNLLIFALSLITMIMMVTIVLLGIKTLRTGESER